MIAPIGVSPDGRDLQHQRRHRGRRAGRRAGAPSACCCSPTWPGVLDADGELIRQLTVAEAATPIDDGVATGGMIPKLETAIAAVEPGVEARGHPRRPPPHAMLVELFTEHGAGTLIGGVSAERRERWRADLTPTVDTWLFDLDNTLYPRRATGFMAADRRAHDRLRRARDRPAARRGLRAAEDLPGRARPDARRA